MKNLLLRKSTRSIAVLALLGLVVLALPLHVSAQTAGFDLLQTSSGTSIDLTRIGLGIVPLKGVSIQTCTGTTDTIMHRTADVPAGGGSVPVEVTALFLKSTSSVTFSGQSVDVYVTVNNSAGVIATSVLPQPDPLSPSTGTLTVRTDGTFDSSITVNADVIFVKAGTSVTNPANYVGHQKADPITLRSSNSSFKTTAPAGYPSCQPFPSGGFFPFPVHTGAHPVTPSTCGPLPAPTPVPVGTQSASAKKGGTPSGAAIAIQKCVSAQ
ncbi:MAG TPA: hypothetical protein VF532_11300 [Candidatus Angelobacter sp.]